MYYIVETDKSFSQASTDLDAAVTGLGFGVLHVHDLGGTLRSKGIAFEEECKIFEICNPAQAAKVLATDMRLNMALPCRISVFTEKGKTKIGLIKPVQCFQRYLRIPRYCKWPKKLRKSPYRWLVRRNDNLRSCTNFYRVFPRLFHLAYPNPTRSLS